MAMITASQGRFVGDRGLARRLEPGGVEHEVARGPRLDRIDGHHVLRPAPRSAWSRTWTTRSLQVGELLVLLRGDHAAHNLADQHLLVLD